MTKRLHITEAEAQGYTVDNSAAGRPWAYKGPRFQPTASCECYTELESQLMTLVPVALAVAKEMPESELGAAASSALANLPKYAVNDAHNT